MADFGRKRKNEGEAEGGTVRRSTKLASSLPPQAGSNNPFRYLPEEVLQGISGFLEITPGGGMWPFCTVIGRHGALGVREKYLRNNDEYLRYCVAMTYSQIKGFENKRTNECLRETKVFEDKRMNERLRCARELLREKIRCWMQANPDWKDLVTAKTMRLSEKYGWLVEDTRFCVRDLYGEQLELMETSATRMEFLKYNGYSKRKDLWASVRCRFGVHVAAGDWLVHVQADSSLLNADTSPFHPMSFLETNRVLKSSKHIHFISVKNPNAIFNNPRVADELGLPEILRFLVEEKGVDCTATTLPGTKLSFGISGVGSFEHINMSALEAAFFESVDSEAFRYLSSTDKVDINVVCRGRYKDTDEFSPLLLRHMWSAIEFREPDVLDLATPIKSVESSMPASPSMCLGLESPNLDKRSAKGTLDSTNKNPR